MAAKRYCGPCDQWVSGRECPACGADTDAPPKGTRTTTTLTVYAPDRQAWRITVTREMNGYAYQATQSANDKCSMFHGWTAGTRSEAVDCAKQRIREGK